MKKNNNGLILFKGRSLINDMPIVVIATGLKAVTSNKKTGDMIQTWILYDGIEPHKAFKDVMTKKENKEGDNKDAWI